MGKARGTQAADSGPPPDKAKQLTEAQAEVAGHRERAAKLLEEKKALQAKLFDSDRKAEAGVKEVLDGFPQGETSELVAKVLELRDPGRTEKKEAIERLGLAVEMENRKATEAALRAKKIEAEIEAEAQDVEAAELHALVLKWLEQYKITNGLRLRLFETTARCSFRNFAERMQRLNLKAGIVVGVLCESYLSKPERRDELNVSAIATAIQDLGKAYGVTLLAQGDERVHGAEDVPMHRNNYFAGFGKAEQMRPVVTTKKK